MNRVTKRQKEIIEAHLTASLKDNFDYPCPKVGERTISDVNDLRTALIDGKTIHQLHKTIEQKFVSVTSQLMASPQIMGHISEAYKKSYAKGFKELLTKLNIH